MFSNFATARRNCDLGDFLALTCIRALRGDYRRLTKAAAIAAALHIRRTAVRSAVGDGRRFQTQQRSCGTMVDSRLHRQRQAYRDSSKLTIDELRELRHEQFVDASAVHVDDLEAEAVRLDVVCYARHPS